MSTILPISRLHWPQKVCPLCTRLGERAEFRCTMEPCPPALIIVRSSSEYLKIAHGKVPEPEQPEPKPTRLKTKKLKPKPKQKPKPRRRVSKPVREVLTHRQVSRLGALARWEKWRREKSAKVNANG